MSVPEIRIRARNAAPPRADGGFVLHWMIAYHRTRWNFALDRAIEWARELGKPVVILEALRCDYPWASERLHRFVLDGMGETREALEGSSVSYYPYVEEKAGAGKGLIEALGRHACVIVTDDFPCFFIPQMVESAAKKLAVRLEAVDSNGLLPLRAAGAAFPTAHAFRRFLQKQLPMYLAELPKAHPLSKLNIPRLELLPEEITRRWPAAPRATLRNSESLATLPIDHRVRSVAIRGGERAARATLGGFLSDRLENYSELRNEPGQEATSGLSPYLHFGHISSHEIFAELMKQEKWSEERVTLRATGSKEGWWGVRLAAEAFLDQLITWRELGFNMAAHRADYDKYESLPDWARATLAKHTRDERSNLYTLKDFAGARTHDPLWNAAQRQLVTEGRVHNYMRMVWGKKILEWSRSPEDALEIMIELNNRYALDGRDPNSYSGIFWCLGRYDRPWGPERPVFGTVRYVSSENTARKFHVAGYLRKFGA
ncbi:MAG TPA: hypothetical protein VEJ38_04375 [Candidatus Acidoferrales bacterium]|nr:hypothetical protein [Candidatus Acidoferrales bacterium]